MDVVGKIIAALPPKSGTSQSTGKPWQVNAYVLQTNEQTPKNIAFDVFGAERVEQYNLKVGDMVTVSIDIDAHEYNGRWYNQIRAWNVATVSCANAYSGTAYAFSHLLCECSWNFLKHNTEASGFIECLGIGYELLSFGIVFGSQSVASEFMYTLRCQS